MNLLLAVFEDGVVLLGLLVLIFQFVFVLIIFSRISGTIVAAIKKTDRPDIRLVRKQNSIKKKNHIFPRWFRNLFLEMFFCHKKFEYSTSTTILFSLISVSAKSLILIVSPSGKSQTKWLTIVVGITFLS